MSVQKVAPFSKNKNNNSFKGGAFPTNTDVAQDSPTDPKKRIVTLDILRGISLLGLVLINIYDFSQPTLLFNIPIGMKNAAFTGWHATLDNVIVWLNWLLIEGKMRSIFSILFGAGVILLTKRYEKTGRFRHAAGIFYRRNLWLLVIGLCHALLIFWGDILVDYAILAMLFLYFLRRLKARFLIISGMILWVVLGTAGTMNGLGILNTLPAGIELRTAKQSGANATTEQKALIARAAVEEKAAVAGIQEQIRIGQLDYWESRMFGINHALGWSMVKSSGLFLSYLGAMIVGMGLFKNGFLTNQKPVSLYFTTMVVGYTISFSVTGFGLWKLEQSGYSSLTFDQWMWIPYCLQVAAGTLANLCLMLLLLRRNFFKKLFSPMAAVGRMALSNYILTNVLSGWLFSWGPFKLYGQLEFYQWYCVVAILWCIIMIFSGVWLKYFRFGPVEWLWRSLTYWKFQPMRIK